MNNSKVYLISDDKSIEEYMSLNLIPLREMDSYKRIGYEKGFKKLGNPDVIIIYCPDDKKDECLKLVNNLRVKQDLYAASIVLILDKFDKEFVIKAYSEEITDYILKTSEKGSTLVKLMWAFRQNAYLKELKKRRSLLMEFGIIDKNTGVYSCAHREKIFEHELNYLDKAYPNSILLLGASDSCKNLFVYEDFVNAVKSSVRSSDLVMQGLNEKLYIILPNTTIKVVEKVFEKIKNNLKNPEIIVGAAINLDENYKFHEIENTLISSLLKSEMTKKKYILVNHLVDINEDEEQDDSWQEWINKNLGTGKNFKIFKAAYKKKKDNIIVPTFFQLQKLYEDKYFEVQISQEIGENTCKFILQQNENEAELQINYNGFSKINVNIVYLGLDSPENENYELDLSKITERYITKLVKNFINTFVKFYS